MESNHQTNTRNINLEERAREFATIAHDGQFRKDKVTPYITHPAAVVELLKSVPYVKNDNILAAAWLHDVVEDCNVPLDRIGLEFNSEIEKIVGALTRNCSRKEYKYRIENADYAVQIVKLADVVHNCSSLYDGISRKTIQNKVDDCKAIYFKLAGKLHLPFLESLMHSMNKHLTDDEKRHYAWAWDD